MSNVVQDFLSQLTDANNPADPGIIPKLAQIAKVVGATAQKNKWTPGQFASNAANDAGNLVSGFVNMVNPYAPHSIPQDIAHPDQIAPDVTNAIKGMGTSMNNTFGQPVNPQTGKLQMPSGEEAAQNFYNQPVNSALNATMVGGALGKLAKVGDVAQVAKVAETARPANWTSEGMKVKAAAGLPALGQKMGFVQKTADEIGAGKVPEVAQNVKDTFLKQFTVPAKIADKINMDKAAQTVIADGIKPDFKSLEAARNVITGGNGEFPKLIYRALGDVKEPVNIGDVMKQGYARIKEVPELADTPAKLQAFQDIMKNIMPAGENGMVDPMDAWDAMQGLERRGYAYAAKSHYLTNNPYYEDLGKAFTDTAKELQDQLEGKLKGVDLSQYETPEMRQNLSNVSPTLLNRYDAMPKTIDSIRSIQKPYVDLGTMMRQTNAASHTAFSNASAMAAKAIAGGGGAAMGAPLGPVGMGAGALIGNSVVAPVLEPLIKAAVEKYGPGMQMAGAKAISNIGKSGLPNIAGAAAKVAPLAALAIQDKSQNPAVLGTETQQQQPAGKPTAGIITNDATPVKYSDIPTDVTQLKPNAQGQYVITSPQNITDKNGKPIAMSEDDYKTQKAQLQQQMGSLSVKYNPQLSAAMESQLQQLETNHTLSTQAQSGYTGAMKASNAVTSTLQTLDKAPINLFNKNQTIQGLNSAYNGKYATLAQQLQILQKYYPVMVDSVLKAPSTDYAKEILSQISNQIAQDYYQGINTLTGNIPGQTIPPSQQTTAQTPTGLPSINQLPINNGNGGTVQGHPLAAF